MNRLLSVSLILILVVGLCAAVAPPYVLHRFALSPGAEASFPASSASCSNTFDLSYSSRSAPAKQLLGANSIQVLAHRGAPEVRPLPCSAILTISPIFAALPLPPNALFSPSSDLVFYFPFCSSFQSTHWARTHWRCVRRWITLSPTFASLPTVFLSVCMILS